MFKGKVVIVGASNVGSAVLTKTFRFPNLLLKLHLST